MDGKGEFRVSVRRGEMWWDLGMGLDGKEGSLDM